MQKRSVMLLAVLLFAALVFGAALFWNKNKDNDQEATTTATYNPIIDPQNFVATVSNPLYALTPGTTYTYQSNTKDGTEKNIIVVTSTAKKILGVTTTEVWDRVWLNDALIEETYDWYAQDTNGDVWYFGEDSKEYENGKVTGTKGSWEAGVSGAKPGIIMEATPKVGDSYRQEYLRGEAEDMADVVALAEPVTVPYGQYTGCLKTRDWSKIDSTLNEFKYYCRDVGAVVLEEGSGGERVELIEVSNTKP